MPWQQQVIISGLLETRETVSSIVMIKVNPGKSKRFLFQELFLQSNFPHQHMDVQQVFQEQFWLPKIPAKAGRQFVRQKDESR